MTRLYKAIKAASLSRVLLTYLLVLYLTIKQRPVFLLTHACHFIEPPENKTDRRIYFTVLAAVIQTTIITLLTAHKVIEAILIIPVFCIYLAGMIAFRQYRTSTPAS